MTRPSSDLQLSIFTRLSEAQADWQQLKDAAHDNPYQSLAWLSAWADTIGEALGVSPRIAVGRRQGKTVFLLPLGLERVAGMSILSFFGHQHGNQNTGLWDKDFYQAAAPAEINALLRDICSQTGADLLKLQNVPQLRHGRTHPLVLDQAIPSPSPGFARALPDDFDQLFRDTHSKSSRKNLSRKERHLQAAGGYQVVRARTEDEIGRGFEAFLEQRALRAVEAGIPNVFNTPETRAFLSRLLGLAGSGAEKPVMDLWYLETGGAIRSTYLCVAHAGTLYAYSNSVAHDDMLANSPGLVLIKEIIAGACADPGLNMLDLGLGAERYKTGWAEPVALCDSLLATTFRGKLQQWLVRNRLKAKAAIRNSPLLWPLVRRLRKLKAGLSKAPDRQS